MIFSLPNSFFKKFLKKVTKKYPIEYLSIYEFSRQDLAPSHGAFFILKNGRRPRTNGYSKAYDWFNYSIFYTLSHILKAFKELIMQKVARAFYVKNKKW